MQHKNRLLNLVFPIACLANLTFADISFAGDTETSSTAPSIKPSARVLDGSAKDREQVTSSIRLVPPTPEPHLLTGAQSHVLNGSVRSPLLNGSTQTGILNGSSGKNPLNSQASATPAPSRSIPSFSTPSAPRADVYHPILPSRITVIPERTYVKPPAKWNYTATPKNGIMTWSAGYASTRVAVPARPAARNPGVTSALEQTSAVPTMQQNIGIVPAAPRSGVNAALIQPSVKGVVQNTTKKPETALEAKARKIPVPQAPPPAVALQATPKLLTELHSSAKRSVNWDEWYRRVCKVVYENWEIDMANPGRTCVRVTAWPGREIEARILSFTPAEGASRDARRETAFRETAMHAVNSLEKTPVLDFPLSSNRGKIVFDLDMNRAVNGPSGIQIAGFHDVEDTTGQASSRSSPHARNASTGNVSSPHALARSDANHGAVKAVAGFTRTSSSLPAAQPQEESTAPNAFQTAAMSLASRAYRSSMDMANTISRHLQFLRWKDSSAPTEDVKAR